METLYSSPSPSLNLQPVSTFPSKSESVSSKLPLIPYDESYDCTCTTEQRTEDEALDCKEREDTNGSNLSSPSSTLNPNVDDNQEPPLLLHLSFNQECVCFAAGTNQGFRIYSCDPFGEIFRRVFDEGGGIGVVEMLHRWNLFALVGGGSDPQYSPTKVMIWDDAQSKCIGELSFRSDVRAVRLRPDCIVVVLEKKIVVYNLTDLKLLHQIDTLPNRRGLCAVSPALKSFVLACPSTHEGQVRVEHFSEKRTKFIMAHDSRIACVVLSYDGKLLATASTKGTLIRIFNTMDGTLLQEVRRGAVRAEIYSLAFSRSAKYLAVSSDKGTIHVFRLKVEYGSPEYYYNSQTASNLSFIKGVLPKYFSSERSVCQFNLPEGCQYIVSFGHEKNTIVILGMDGSFYRCQFDPLKGGKMKQLDFHNFLSSKETF